VNVKAIGRADGVGPEFKVRIAADVTDGGDPDQLMPGASGLCSDDSDDYELD
jgi:hypothetical protein